MDVDDNVFREPRETWANRLEFLLATIGYTVGAGSVYRFPIICARNGGTAFLVPMMLILLLVGGPIYYLEINLGQFTGKCVTKSFAYCPLFKGTAYLVMTLSFTVVWYLFAVLVWVLYFLYNSFFTPLPWTVCSNEWNTPNCSLGINASLNESQYTMTNETEMYNTTRIGTSHPAVEFWKYNVLSQSEGLENMGTVQLHLLLCLFLACLMAILGIVNGVKSLGKVVYVTALFPYVLLTILFVRGVTLDGAMDGLWFFLKFETHRLVMYQTWLDASVQVFYSLGPIWGGVITLASYNKFNQQSFVDTIIICSVDMFTCVYASLIVFSVLGFMAKQSGISIVEIVTSSGPGLAFVAYPTAISMMPLPRLWAVLFFLMMLLLMLDSQFGMIETLTLTLFDEFPNTLGRHKVLMNLLFGGFMVLACLVFTTNGSVYVFVLVDWYCTAFGLLIGACLEVSSISLIYGIDRFAADISMMTGRSMSKFARFLYCVLIPLLTPVTFVLMLSQYNEPTYGDSYVYKPYAIIIGFMFGLLPVFNFCVCLVVTLLQEEGSFMQRVKRSLRPSIHWGPKDPTAASLYTHDQYVYESTWTARLRTNLFGSKETSLF